MIRRSFLDSESRQDLIELARDGSVAHRLARRANALVLLDDGMSCEAIAEAMHAWLTEQLARISGRSTLAQAIGYALNHWKGLILFLDDGRLELDTNTVERAMRPVALGRKNALFAGADSGGRHWAIVATLIQTAKLNGVDPWAWLIDVLERIVSGRTKRHELDTLLPWNWAAEKAAEATSSA